MKQFLKDRLFFIPFFLLLFSVFTSFSIEAQPGWRDETGRYFYSILDENGSEIVFKSNSAYSIMVNDVLYGKENFPDEILSPAIQNEYNFGSHISINDFSLNIPFQNLEEKKKLLEIKIIHHSDTLFICQTSGQGPLNLQRSSNKSVKFSADLTLQFIPGHYYFPFWAKGLLDNMPKTSGNVKIVNNDQRHFIVDESVYNSICYFDVSLPTRTKRIRQADSIVAQNFAKGYFSIERKSEPTTLDKSIAPFNSPHWNYSKKTYYPTDKEKQYLGLIEGTLDTLNWYIANDLLVRYDLDENKMKIWSPTKEVKYSGTPKLYYDQYNHVFYNRTFIRDTNGTSFIFGREFTTQFYSSNSDGKKWEKHRRLTALFNQNEFRELEFLDQEHALIYVLRKVKMKGKNYDIQQGTYYLLKNFEIIDSLKSPDDLHYNDNYYHYNFSTKNDTILLGLWSYSQHSDYGETYFQPFMQQNGDAWKFQLMTGTFRRPDPNQPKETLFYDNFKILNENELNFGDDNTLKLGQSLSNPHLLGRILENGKQIFMVGLNIGTLFSFDGGMSWYIYPLQLEEGSQYHFISIDEDGTIVHLKNGEFNYETLVNRGFTKVYQKIIPE